MSTSNEKFVVYWLGYKSNPPTLQSLPAGIDILNLFLFNLESTTSGTSINYDYLTSKGTSWSEIQTQVAAVKAKGVKVCASIIPPNATLIWNTIPDPDTFALNLYNLIISWGFDGIDIDPEQGGSVTPNQNFVDVMIALSKYFGPKSNTGLILSYVGYQINDDKIVLEPTVGIFDYVMTMGYFWDYKTMITQFGYYADIVGNENVLFGIGGDPWQTALSETKQLAAWEPTNGNKGGMMEFNINDDTNYDAANAIIKVIALVEQT